MISFFLFGCALTIPFVLEFLVLREKLSRGRGFFDAVALRILRSGAAMAVVCYLLGAVPIGQFGNYVIVLQLLLLSAFVWLPATLAAMVVLRKRPIR